jgi:hypothetical protein
LDNNFSISNFNLSPVASDSRGVEYFIGHSKFSSVDVRAKVNVFVSSVILVDPEKFLIEGGKLFLTLVLSELHTICGITNYFKIISWRNRHKCPILTIKDFLDLVQVVLIIHEAQLGHIVLVQSTKFHIVCLIHGPDG